MCINFGLLTRQSHDALDGQTIIGKMHNRGIRVVLIHATKIRMMK